MIINEPNGDEILETNLSISETSDEIFQVKKSKSFFGGLSNKVADMSNIVIKSTSETSKKITEKATEVTKIITETTSQTSKTVLQVSNETGKIINNKALETSQIIRKNTKEATNTITAATSQASKMLTETTSKMGENLTIKANDTNKKITETMTEINKNVTETTKKGFEELDKVTELIVNNPLLAKVIEQVDLEKAEQALMTLQEKYPEESPSQIAQRLMQQKAIYAGSTGFASSLLPGAAMAFLALDLAAVAGLQAEMVYQIAGAYGVDLKASQRKKEILSIFGIALGGTHAASAGLQILRTTPALGAIIGASSNVAMTYAVGYSACRFYENQILNSNNTQNLIASAVENNLYLEEVIFQEKIMNQILLSFIIAEKPDKTWEEIESQLNLLNFSSESMLVLREFNNSQTNLDTLLEKLDENFALPLYLQCEKIITINEENKNEEQSKIMEKIKEKITVENSIF